MGFGEEDRFAEDGEAARGASDPRAFRRDELVACERCGRKSPPTRIKCLYCGAQLPVAERGEDMRRPALKPLEEWERGFNVVLAPRGGDAAAPPPLASVAEAASLVRLKPEQFGAMIASGVPLPLARTGEHEEVALIVQRLGALGLAVEVVSDEELAIEERPPRRVRRFEFDEETINAWASADGEARRARWDEIALVAAGRIFKKRIEVEEQRSRRGAGEVVESRELSEDEGVLDIFFEDDSAASWRLQASGFDYSCLGAGKSLLASENFARLAGLVRERAARAVFDDSYSRVRHLLRFAWSPTERREAGGLRRARPGRFSTEAV
ncbi:MAG: hypothetical protein ABR563_15860, partial [Pyrinomonadaceae bacterium]